MSASAHHRLDHHDLRDRAFRGIVWSYAAYAVQFAVQAIALVVLARQLSVEDFGIFTLGLMIVGVGETLFRMGFGPSIVQLKTLHDDHVDVAWTSNLLISLGAVMLLSGGTWLFVGNGQAAMQTKLAVLVMLVSVLLNAVMSPGLLLLHRNMQTRDFIFISTTRILVRYCGAIILAFWFKSYWALVIAFVAGYAVEVPVSYLIAGRRPRLVWRKSIFCDLFRFSRWLHLKNVLRWGSRHLDSCAVATLLGVPALGIYNRALNLAGLPNQQTELLSYRIFFPMFASAQHDPQRLRRLVSHATNVLLLTALPVLLFMALHGPSIIRLILGEKWSAANTVLGLLSFGLLLRSLNDLQASALRAIGEPRFEFIISVVQIGLTGSLLVPLILWRGAEGAALALVSGSIVAVVVTERLMRQRLGVDRASQAISIGGSIAGAAVACVMHVALADRSGSLGMEAIQAIVEVAAFFAVQAALFAITRDGLLRTVWWAFEHATEKLRRRSAYPLPVSAAI